MGFSFYPKHEHKCPHVSHCPHLGGAALGTLVLRANGEEQSRRTLQAKIDAELARNERLVTENERLKRELDQVKLELKLERQNKFATNQQKRDSDEKTAPATTPATSDKKRSAEPRSAIRDGLAKHRRHTTGPSMSLLQPGVLSARGT